MKLVKFLINMMSCPSEAYILPKVACIHKAKKAAEKRLIMTTEICNVDFLLHLTTVFMCC